MYGGYAWLTNTMGTATQRQRVVLLLGMAAFFLVSLAVPRAFGDDGVAFGIAYILLNAVHLAGFLRSGAGVTVAAMLRIGVSNLVSAAMILGAGIAGSPWHWWLFGLAVAIQWLTPVVLRTAGNFNIDTAHFAERHG